MADADDGFSDSDDEEFMGTMRSMAAPENKNREDDEMKGNDRVWTLFGFKMSI